MEKTGVVSWYNSVKGEGVITDDYGKEFFFGFGDLETRVFEIEERQRVQFRDSGRYLSTQKMNRANAVKFI